MGFAENSTELWNNFIFPRLPKKDVVLHWHKILTEYIKRSDATFALTTAGYKIAHIYNVGTDYYSNGKFLSLSDIVEKYFPRGERTDWSERIDSYGKYFLRDLIVSDEAKNYLVAEFLRFVHPFNYFLMPKMTGKKTQAIWACPEGCKDAAEYTPLLDFVRNKFAEIYGDAYEEFLDLIMVDKENLGVNSLGLLSELTLKILYGVTFTKEEKQPESNSVKKRATNFSSDFPEEIKLAVLKEYLKNPTTSFRKLEIGIMSIESPVRGGGFKAKNIVNSYGAFDSNKGILSKYSIEAAAKFVDDRLRENLLKYKEYLDS